MALAKLSWSSDSSCFLTDQLQLSGERSVVMANYGKSAPGTCLFLTLQCCLPKLLPVVTPLSSKLRETPVVAMHFIWHGFLPGSWLYPKLREKKVTWSHNPMFANCCHSRWFMLGSKLFFKFPYRVTSDFLCIHVGPSSILHSCSWAGNEECKKEAGLQQDWASFPHLLRSPHFTPKSMKMPRAMASCALAATLCSFPSQTSHLMPIIQEIWDCWAVNSKPGF